MKIEDLMEWFIVPSEWWSQLIVLLSRPGDTNSDSLFIENIPSLNSSILVDEKSKYSKVCQFFLLFLI